jgi:branched-chain amino acid aminotransferase
MHKFVSFNNKILDTTEIAISPISSAAFYGKGIFTTIAIRNRKPFLWEKHWRRLTDNASRIGLDISEFSENSILDSISELIETQKVSDARCRLTFFDESPGKLWSIESNKKTSLLITTAENRNVANLKLMLSPFRLNSTSPLANIKSCNYLENILALENAKKNGFDEAILLNERNEITSAAMANIFWTHNGNLFTPSLKTGCLTGTIRELVIESREVFEVEQNISGFQFDDIFLTSSGLGIVDAYFGEMKQSSESIRHKKILDFTMFKK